MTAIIIPAHNRIHHTLHCMEQLRWCAALPDWKIVLVDDGSTDGTGESVRQHDPHVEIVQGSGDLFWTGGIVAGMRRAIDLGCTEIVWMNDDTDCDPSSIRRLASLVRQDPALVVTASVLVNGGPVPYSSLDRRPVLAAPGQLAPADVLPGFLTAFNVSLVRSIGFPDAFRFPHYAGDSAYTRAAHNAGFRLCVDGDSFVSLCEPERFPSAAEHFWAAGRKNMLSRIQSTFFSRRSRFRLLTQWNLDRVYRGTLRGTAAFLARLSVWMLQIAIRPVGRIRGGRLACRQ
jgi:GT2 family glycosyltransferase